MAKASTKKGAVTIRFGGRKRDIQRGAKLAGMSFNTFVVRVADEAARTIIKNPSRTFIVTPRTTDEK